MIGKVEQQYNRHGLYESIYTQLIESGIDLTKIKREDIAGVDEFHIRGADVSKELATEIGITGQSVLDIGCGIGGPCRMLKEEFNCNVTGIDLNADYIRTAQKLTQLLGLDINFQQANALELPFKNNLYDVVWTQHVQMNIENKAQFYSEIKRVSKPGGLFLYYDIFEKNGEGIDFPVPWADDNSISFLFNTRKLDEELGQLGMEKIQSKDQTKKGIEFFEAIISQLDINGPPKIGLHLLMGDSAREKLGNVLKALKEGKIELESGIYQNTIS